ncbi:MAG: aminopeptidase P family protein [Hyphomicrobiaceae bacterium]
MFQDFASEADPRHGIERTARLRAKLGSLGVEAVVVPRSDEHMGEYVPAASERLAWLTGFTGSAGLAMIGRRKAAVFVDGRYTLQAAEQVDKGTFEIVQFPDTDPLAWMAAKLDRGAVLGFDPWLHTTAWVRQAREKLATRDITLKALARNPVDLVWGSERPKPPCGEVIVQPLKHAGRRAEEKIADLQTQLKAAQEDACIITLPDSIAWLFNIRGSDVKHNPTPLAFAIVHAGAKPELFIDAAKLDKAARQHLGALARLRQPGELKERVAGLKTAKKRVRLDENTAAHWFRKILGERSKLVVDGKDPCILPKARKNDAEIAGTRTAHERDGVAMAHFLAWLDREAPTGRLTEIDVVTHLETCRMETQALREISFDTISGSGPNGAIVHYRVTTKTNRKISAGELLLVDSGAQYQDGTTDVTRTIAVGQPTAEMRDRFTLVLKGHIAIATSRFPAGTTGAHIDAFARRALWQQGLDFDHGTGHGVGSYLSVHEGPQSISKRGHVALEPGMIVSNEPGYYKTGAYGIRIENLELVTEPAMIAGGERPMLGFETLTLIPMDRRLISPALLSAAEIAWLDAYHARVARVIGPHLSGETLAWLTDATKPLADGS